MGRGAISGRFGFPLRSSSRRWEKTTFSESARTSSWSPSWRKTRCAERGEGRAAGRNLLMSRSYVLPLAVHVLEYHSLRYRVRGPGGPEGVPSTSIPPLAAAGLRPADWLSGPLVAQSPSESQDAVDDACLDGTAHRLMRGAHVAHDSSLPQIDSYTALLRERLAFADPEAPP